MRSGLIRRRTVSSSEGACISMPFFAHGMEVHGGRKQDEITVDCLNFLTEVGDRALECGDSRPESLILIHSIRN